MAAVEERMNSNPLVQPLLTDFYQITMAYAYWKSGKVLDNAVFDLFFRRNPFQGEFTVFAGLEECVHFVRNFHYSDSGRCERVSFFRKNWYGDIHFSFCALLLRIVTHRKNGCAQIISVSTSHPIISINGAQLKHRSLVQEKWQFIELEDTCKRIFVGFHRWTERFQFWSSKLIFNLIVYFFHFDSLYPLIWGVMLTAGGSHSFIEKNTWKNKAQSLL